MSSMSVGLVTKPVGSTNWEVLRPHRLQSLAYRSRTKFVALACGRGSGKTELARRRVVRALPVPKPYGNPIYFYILPTQAQAKRVAWKPLLELIPDEWIANINIADMTIDTIFGSTLYVLGADKPERIEGVQWDGGVVDEACDHKAGGFDASLIPALAHRCDFCWRIGVPKRFGPSAVEFKNFFMKGLEGRDPLTFSAAWPSKDIAPPELLEWAKDNLDPSDYAEQFNATWLSAAGGIFVEFDEDISINSTVRYWDSETIFVGCDFNVDPMCWNMSHLIAGQVHTFDELTIRNTTTVKTLDALIAAYPNHAGGWVFIGDAAAKHRSTSADLTDYLHINNDPRFGEKGIIFADSNPSLVSRFSTCNSALRNAADVRRAYINPKCVTLIKDLKHRAYKPGTSIPDTSDATLGHASDAWGYKIMSLLPIPVDISGIGAISTLQDTY